MVTTTSRRKLKYFFAAFGDPDNRPPVDGGCYPHHKGYITNSGIRAGDIALLYCTENYLEHYMEAPGVGIVTAVETGGEKEKFDYHYLPLDCPVDWDTIKGISELKDCTNFGLRGNWLREISNASFQKVLSGRQIIWP